MTLVRTPRQAGMELREPVSAQAAGRILQSRKYALGPRVATMTLESGEDQGVVVTPEAAQLVTRHQLRGMRIVSDRSRWRCCSSLGSPERVSLEVMGRVGKSAQAAFRCDGGTQAAHARSRRAGPCKSRKVCAIAQQA